jgi:hypothetical protein
MPDCKPPLLLQSEIFDDNKNNPKKKILLSEYSRLYCKPPWRSTIQIESEKYKSSLSSEEAKLAALDKLLNNSSRF